MAATNGANNQTNQTEATAADLSGSPIDGGFVQEIQEPPFDEPKHRAQTAEKLALIFSGILSGALLVHYICFMILILTGKDKAAIEVLSQTLNVWLPALTGIMSSAATYYFTRER